MEGKKKILIVDGDKHTRDCIEAIFETWYTIVTAGNSEEALETYKREKPDYVFAEFFIEPNNAKWLTKEIRNYESSEGKRSKIFISTDGSADVKDMNVEGFFNKTVDIDTMLNKLMEMDGV